MYDVWMDDDDLHDADSHILQLRSIRAVRQSWNVKVKAESLLGLVIIDEMHVDVCA